MKLKLTYLILILISCALGTKADDLYRVSVTSSEDLGLLAELKAEPIHQGPNVLLLLVKESSLEALHQTGLETDLLAPNVIRDRLVIDSRRDLVNAKQLQPLYEEGQYRLYLLDEIISSDQLLERHLLPVSKIRTELTPYHETTASARSYQPEMMDLTDLINLVSQDSIWSYDSILQAFPGRLEGTLGNRQARDFLKAKLESFGYPNVEIDTFDNGGERYNIVATKTGTTFPDHIVVLGAHMDAVNGSPGADDNGSGSSGVLEIARVLKDIDTDMTIQFVLFDAEESGLNGAWHFAQEAFDDGDNIVFMLNQDMIGSVGNTNQASLYYGPDTQYAVRWAELADSLLGITAVMEGSAGNSDHYPFSQFGYTVTFASEYVFSPVYHSPQDSTTYIDPVYMTKMVKASLATAYWVNAAEGPVPSLVIDYDTPLPDWVLPDSSVEFELTVSSIYGGVHLPGTGVLYYSLDGGPLQTVAMTDLGSDRYQAVLPAADCFSQIEYYVSVEETTTGLVYDPDPASPRLITIAESYNVDFSDDFETNLGWTSSTSAASGQWQRGIPVNDPGWSYDPVADADGSGSCFLTQNEFGNTDVDGGSVQLVSPVFDFLNGGSISYFYLLNLTNTNGADRLLVELNNSGGTGSWVTVATHTENSGLFWAQHTITEDDISSAGLSFTSNMKIRFTANDSDPQSIVEAGVDGFLVSHYECEPSCCGMFTAGYPGNTNCDVAGKRSLADITELIDHVYITKDPLCCDENGNTTGDLEGQVNLADITKLIDHIYISKLELDPCL